MARAPEIAPKDRPGDAPFVQVIERHDSLQVEIKRDYPTSWCGSAARWRIDAFLFTPKSFGVDPDTTSKEALFSIVQTFYRWREDARAYNELVARSDRASPLARVEEGLGAILDGRPVAARPLADLARRAGGLARAFLKERTIDLCDALDRLELAAGSNGRDETGAEAVRANVALFLDQVERLLERFRFLRVKTQQAQVALPPELVEAATLVDEHVTAKAESALAQLLGELEQAAPLQDGRGGRAALEVRARAIVRDVARARTRAGFTTVGRTPVDAERFAFKQSLLKKYTDRPLYLLTSIRRGEEGGKVKHAIGAFAAALAASWAFLAQVYTQQFAVASAVTGIIALSGIIAYMVKDRMKDFVKDVLMRQFRRYVPDRAVSVKEPAQNGAPPRVVAYASESIRFLAPDEVPPDVRAARGLGHSVDVGAERQEEVIHYRRAVDLSPAHELGLGPTIREIQRLEVSEFLERLDDPEQHVLHYDLAHDRAVNEEARKVYHLNVVVRIAPAADGAAETPPHYGRTRVVLTKRGISRVEEALPLETPEEMAERIQALERGETLRGIGR